jgi:ATP-binding protein involved in chromosome partitioning
VKDGVMTLALDVGGLAPDKRDGLAAAIRDGGLTVPGVTDVRIAMTAERKPLRILAVASGKGGVGKSTLSANLAVALHRLGIRVGLVDADIYGPSQAKLMASEDQKPIARDKKLVPVTGVAGIPMLSMAHLVEPGRALAWRGPMVGNALTQLIDAEWGDTELLVVDMPPGTGDIQLTMVQKHKPAGALIVSTPQDLALIDATRAVSLFNQVGVPMVGLVENMAGYACPHCGEISDPFGQGGAESTAGELSMPFLGRIPLAIDIRRRSDAGDPPAAGEGPHAAAFRAIAEKVAEWLRAVGG